MNERGEDADSDVTTKRDPITGESFAVETDDPTEAFITDPREHPLSAPYFEAQEKWEGASDRELITALYEMKQDVLELYHDEIAERSTIKGKLFRRGYSFGPAEGDLSMVVLDGEDGEPVVPDDLDVEV